MNLKKREGASIWVSVVVVLAVALAATGALVYPYFGSPSASTTTSTTHSGSTVRVFGLVSAIGAGVSPTRMVFTDSKTGQVTAAPVSGGSYSVQLPNHRSYNVSLAWTGNYSWQLGREDIGQMMVDMSEGSMMAQSFNVAQPTPDAQVLVSGTVMWQMMTSQPTSIKFQASNGLTFQAPVVGRTFSIMLPNMMTYQVNVAATNSTGHNDWFYFHQLKVEAGINVVGITVRLG